MKAFILDRYGSKVALRAGELPDPDVREDEVLVQVHAAGVNLLDSKIRNGEFKLILPYRAPFVLGHDVAGVVVRVGARVKHFKPGDEVYARPADHRIGTFAELIAVQEKDVALKPKKLTMEEAASIPLVGLTAWQALVERGQLKRGQKVFIQAGSGGVGTFAIQLAKHLGATVATTTSTSNIELVRSLGADVIVDYKKEDFESKLSDYDLVLHSQDGKALVKSLRVLRSGRTPRLDLGSSRSGLRRRDRRAMVREARHQAAELRREAKGKEPRHRILLSLHEGERRPAARDHRAHRCWSRPPGGRQGLSIPVDE